MSDLKWRLPDGVDEVLPPRARQLELLRRRVLDVFDLWGFDYIDLPIIEFADSLLVGGDESLNLQTLKVVDQVTGRTMGVRADMTAQAMRMDANLRRTTPARVCYAGTVVHAVPFGVHGSRIPLKAGAEIFGVPDDSADAQVIALMVEVLQQAGLGDPTIVLGHMEIYASLVRDLALSESAAAALFAAVQRKSEPDIAELVPAGVNRQLFMRLPTLMGEASILDEARRVIGPKHPKAQAAVDRLEALAAKVSARCSNIRLHFDLAELAGFGYHNGPVFSAYHASVGQAVARGGRYDNVGGAFGGEPRAATGFDVNLKPLLDMVTANQASPEPDTGAVWLAADHATDPTAMAEVARLRTQGRSVLVGLLHDEVPPAQCTQQLSHTAGKWQLVSL